MTKEQFESLDLRPQPKTPEEVEKGIAAIRKRQEDFRNGKTKRYKVEY